MSTLTTEGQRCLITPTETVRLAAALRSGCYPLRHCARRWRLDGWRNAVNDNDGVRFAGLRTIWFGNTRSWPTDIPRLDHEVPHIRAAIDLLLLTDANRARTST